VFDRAHQAAHGLAQELGVEREIPAKRQFSQRPIWAKHPIAPALVRGNVHNIIHFDLGNMSPRICICCGEPIDPEWNFHSRNPNVCAACSSILDGMEESESRKRPEPSPAAQSAKSFQPEALVKAD
jgi:hypothetical protein